MKRIVLLAAGSAILNFSGLRAQDFHLAQYDAAPLFLNPAMTGMFDGYYRIHAHYRTQWAAVATKPFQTTQISFDMPVKRMSLGGQILNYRAGAGNYNALSLVFSGGYDLSLDANEAHHISLGAQIGFIRKTVDINRLYFESQYFNTAGSTGFDTGLPNDEGSFNNGIFEPDANFGFMYYYSGEQKRLNPFIGASAFHLTTPKETFYNNENDLPFRYVIHGGTKINLTSQIQLLPKFLLMHHTTKKDLPKISMVSNELIWSVHVHYYLKESDSYIFGGPSFRKKDAAVAEVGMKYGRYTCRVSYDINTSSLEPYTNGRGGFEISLTYIAKKQKPNPIPSCPRL